MSYFKKEIDLVKELTKHIDLIHKKKNSMFILSKEESAGLGIFDVAVFEINKKLFRKRAKARLGTPITSESMLSVLIHLNPRKKTSLLHLQSQTGINPSHLRSKVLKYLVSRKYVIKHDGSLYTKRPEYTNFLKSCVAIEAKLEKWKSALQQAYRYKAFASETYVALSSKHITNATKYLNQFKAMNVGLIEVAKGNGLKILFRPTKEIPKSKIAVQLCNELVIKRYYRKFLSQKSVKAFSHASR